MKTFHFQFRLACLAGILALAGSGWGAAAPASSWAQRPAPQSESWKVRGRITDAHHQPILGVRVSFELPGGGDLGVSLIETDVFGEFRTTLAFVPVPEGERGARPEVVLKAEKQGFHPGWDLLEKNSPEGSEDIVLILQDEDRVGNLPIPETIASELSGRYTKSEHLEPFSPAARDDCLRGAKDFLAGEDPIKGVLRLHKALDADPACHGCQFLLGVAYLQGGAWPKAEKYLSQSAGIGALENPSAKSGDPLTVLAVMRILADDWEGARKFLASAIDADPASPLVLREFGRFLMFQGQLERADQCFRDALSKGATPEVHLLRSEAALLGRNLGLAKDQYRAYFSKLFPRHRGGSFSWAPNRVSPYSGYVRQEITTYARFESYGRVESVVNEPLEKAVSIFPPLKGIKPAVSQQGLEPLLKQMGAAVEDLISRLPNTISDERLAEKRIGSKGKIKDAHDIRLQYLLLMRPKWATTFAVEHRLDPAGGAASSPESKVWLTTINSMMAMTLLDPRHRAGTEFRLLGSQDLGGRATQVVGFAQVPLVSKVQGHLSTNRGEIPYLLQGVAWTDQQTGHILRIRSELLKPLKDAGIRSHATDVDYAETRVEGAPGGYWLPRRITVRVEGPDEIYEGLHTFSNYRLYRAESTIKTDLGDLR